ncbi:unnamed protein product [Effrenium voratum]|nr:unnamed protein product [Effrenium voratum]
MPGSHHGEDAEEEEQVQVGRGRIRLQGHFCGVAVTASHRLELAIPVEEEVDINVLLPLLNGFKDSRKAKEPPEADGSPTNSKFDSSLWSTLEELLEIDRKGIEEEGDQVMEEMMGSFEPGWREAFTRGETFMRGETFVRGVSRRSSDATASESELAAKLREEERELRVTKAHERALEVDFQAKEKLVQNLMEERKDLRAKTMELEHALEHSGAERWLCSCLSGLSALLGKKESPGREVLDTINEAEEEKDVEKAMERAMSMTELEEGQVIIEGHFAGQMVTKAHHMEVTMPLGATIPGVPVVELLRVMRDATSSQEDEKMQQHAEVLSSVLALLEVDVLPDEEAPEGEDGDGPRRTPSYGQVAQKKMAEMSKEIEVLHAEQSRIQREAEQLRARNSTLATFLASAERSAAQLRTALTEAGISIGSPKQAQGEACAEDTGKDFQADVLYLCLGGRVDFGF